ncbi:MAG: heavy-metal-associated domain-containing protein, partial [Mycobacterium sp.]|nr:heavy-metal-associated domain-containing protein [Mycobacterium sp.]
MSQMQTYLVRGMTCGHCVGAVTGELEGIDTVTAVTVDVVPEGDSGRAARRSSLGVSDGLC